MRVFILFVFLLFVLLVSSCVQPKWPSAKFVKRNKYFEVPTMSLSKNDSLDRYPMFPAGINGISQHMNHNLYVRCSGQIFITYVVNVDGYTEEVKVIEGYSTTVDNAIKKVFEDMPRWIPAMKDSVPVKASMFYTIYCF